MKIHRLQREQLVARPAGEVFAFFARPENLARITPDALDFRILTPEPVPMHAGTLIDYRIRLFGLPVRWRTLIADYDPPRSFTDQQLRGPYDFWHHHHRFEADGDATRMTDTVHYALPFDPFSRPVHGLWVAGQLGKIFDYRAEAIEREFGVADRSPQGPRLPHS